MSQTTNIAVHLAVAACLAFLCSPFGLRGAVVLAPPNAASQLDGNSSATPFDPADSGRFQQVFDASAFAEIANAGGGWIRAVSFRIDASTGHDVSGVISNVQLNLSTTFRNHDSLSENFAENVGNDDMIVLGPSQIQVSSLGGGGFTGFSFSFLFETPYFYNPAGGNLLVDFRIYSGLGYGITFPPFPPPPPPPSAILDAFNIVGDSVSSVYAHGAVMPTVGVPSSLGLATAFSITPVPEPSSVLLYSLGLGVLLATWKRIRQHD
jgi:hypothetical protein